MTLRRELSRHGDLRERVDAAVVDGDAMNEEHRSSLGVRVDSAQLVDTAVAGCASLEEIVAHADIKAAPPEPEVKPEAEERDDNAEGYPGEGVAGDAKECCEKLAHTSLCHGRAGHAWRRPFVRSRERDMLHA